MWQCKVAVYIHNIFLCICFIPWFVYSGEANACHKKMKNVVGVKCICDAFSESLSIRGKSLFSYVCNEIRLMSLFFKTAQNVFMSIVERCLELVL